MRQYLKCLSQISVITIFCLLPSLLFAQGGPGGDPDVVPVDGGLSILAAAGVAYSVKKIKDYRKKRNEVEK
ncbi:MAG: hypothetical protein M3004_06730 [Bacteroidota bacterium]|nr:hypothetical protein [Bacteroidota bacterium]